MGLLWTQRAIKKQYPVDLADLGDVSGISTDSYNIFNKYECWKVWATLTCCWDLDHYML